MATLEYTGAGLQFTYLVLIPIALLVNTAEKTPDEFLVDLRGITSGESPSPLVSSLSFYHFSLNTELRVHREAILGKTLGISMESVDHILLLMSIS